MLPFFEWSFCVWRTTRFYCLSQSCKCDLVCGCETGSRNIRFSYSECNGGMIMNYMELMEKSREVMGNKIYVSLVLICDGKGHVEIRFQVLVLKGLGMLRCVTMMLGKNIRVNMDTITDNEPVSTELELFGHTFKYPIFAGPVGAVAMHYSDAYDDNGYNDILVKGCIEAGICAFYRRWKRSSV